MLEAILLVVSIMLVVVVLLQGNKATGASHVFTGGNEALFANMKERGFELFISRLTLVLGVLFFVLSFILFLQ